ncbi:MAG TPA: hypothetical protein DEP84_36720 [Chloroflexi bacterium]|nr:hypothetical protein [Chloroflexota bacterium]
MPATTPGNVSPHFLVIVPGYMGSKLRDRTTGEIVWVDFQSIPKNPFQWDGWIDHLFGALTYPNENLEPAGVMDEVIFVPPWAKQEHYNRLVEALQGLGYQLGPAPGSELVLYTFPYDWRQDNRLSARQLGAAIEQWSARHPGHEAWIIAHSNGGLVARWYIEKEGGKDRVARLFLMGSPWDGTPKVMWMLFAGLDTLFRRRFNLFDIPRRSRDLFRTFPSAYQLLPVQAPFLRSGNEEPVNPFAGTGWLETDRQRHLLEEGRRFNEELGTTLSVETLCFFGRKIPTVTQGMVTLAAGGLWSAIRWLATEAGDGTIPEHSAVHPQAREKLPFAVGHGDIYVTPAVLEFLEWELIDKYRAVSRAAVVTERLTVMFEPDRDVYSPGETIDLWATVHENREGSPPVSGASIKVQLVWRQPLPGMEPTAPSEHLPEAHLWESNETAGRYEGGLVAPDTEGYYQLRALVRAVGEPAVRLEELIAIEAEPDLVGE